MEAYDSDRFDRFYEGRKIKFFWDYNCIFYMALSPYAIALRCYLASLAGDKRNKVWPSLKEISERMNVSRNTAKKAIEELINAGLLRKELRRSKEGDYANTVYTLLDPPEEVLLKHNSQQEENEGGGSPDDLPLQKIAGGSPDDLPPPKMAGGRSPDDQRVGHHVTEVGHEVITTNNNKKDQKDTLTLEDHYNVSYKEVNLVEGSSLRSDPSTRSAALRASGGGNIFTGEKQNEPSPPDSSQEEKNVLPSFNFTITEKFRSRPEVAFTVKASEKTEELQCSSEKNKQETPEAGREQKEDYPHPPYPPPPSSPKVTEYSDKNGLTNKDIISALGDAFLAVPGMAERYDGPQKKRVYALMGRLYHRLDCEPVYQAIDALKKKAGAVDDPLHFVAGVAEKCAQKDKERKMGEEEYYAALRRKVDRALERVGGNADLLTAEERKWVKDLNAYDWYQAVKANGEKWRREHPDYRERMKQYYEERKKANEELRRQEEEKRQKEREQLLMLIYQPEPSDPALKQIADAQREIAQKELEKLDSLDIFLPDGKKVKHIATIAEELFKDASA